MKQISMTESTVREAMAQIDSLEECTPKDKGCLRLLTEEMFSMVNELLKTEKLTFQIECDGKKYALRVSAKTRVSEEAREHFLSMSTDGRNAANKGIKGMIGAVMEAFSWGDDVVVSDAPWSYGMCSYEGEHAGMWALSMYMDTAPQEKVRADWDGMEKSIIANFSDDVVIGVRSGRLEMTVTKAFA